MDRPRPRQRLGLLAFAFDARGRSLLDAIVQRPDLGDALVVCLHGDATDGLGESDAGDQVPTPAPIHWHRRRPGTGWTPPPWAESATDLASGFEAAVRDALDAKRWQSAEGGVDLVDLLLIAAAEPAERVDLPAGTHSALAALRRRFRRLGRVLLVVERRFQTVGQAGVAGKVSPLPSETDNLGLFDLVLLFDRVNLEGLSFNDEQEAVTHSAAGIVQLTVGELAATLFEQLQAVAARRPSGGRCLAVGVAEWRLTPESISAATGDLLYRRMAAELVAEAEAGTAEDRETDETESRVEDPWPNELAGALQELKTTDDPEKRTEELDGSGLSSLEHLLRARGWSLAHLVSLLNERRDRVLALERGAITELAEFMPRFASWYARWKIGHKQTRKTSRTETREKWIRRRVAVFLVLLGMMLTAVVGAMLSPFPLELGIAAGLLGAGAAVILAWGLQESIPIEVPIELPVEDMQPELRLRRARVSLVAALRNRCEGGAKGLEQALETLRSQASGREGQFPHSDEVCDALLAHRSVEAQAEVPRFWAERGRATLHSLARAGGLAQSASDHARDRCRELGSVDWGELFEALGGEGSLDEPLWRRALEAARDAAVPRMPVAGATSHSFLVLPGGLPEPMKEILVHHFPEQVTPLEISGDAVLVVRVTQGYESSDGDAGI